MLFYPKQVPHNNTNKNLTLVNKLPNKLQIYDVDIDVIITRQKEGIFNCTSMSTGSKLVLQNFILDNISGNTGFMICLPHHCFSCMFEHDKRNNNTKYYLIILN